MCWIVFDRHSTWTPGSSLLGWSSLTRFWVQMVAGIYSFNPKQLLTVLMYKQRTLPCEVTGDWVGSFHPTPRFTIFTHQVMWSIVFQLRRYTKLPVSWIFVESSVPHTIPIPVVRAIFWKLQLGQAGTNWVHPVSPSPMIPSIIGPTKFLDDPTKGSQHSSLSWLNPNSWSLHNHLWLDDPFYQSLLVNSPHVGW